MSDYNLHQLTVDNIIETGFTFEIPNYQRGYRWGKNEVTDLLEDIMDIKVSNGSFEEIREECKTHPYCLQPISFDIRKEDENVMIVVDGQQRLTTLFLILNFVRENLLGTEDSTLKDLEIKNVEQYFRNYKLIYEDITREKTFEKIEKNLEKSNIENIDAYYITQAYQTISQWWNKRESNGKRSLTIFANKVLYGTSVIWYEINTETDGTPNDYFAKTNTGRIPLTNSELIKANLMLDEYCREKIDRNSYQRTTREETEQQLSIENRLKNAKLDNDRNRMSRQWDEIESSLRNDEFWYFLTEESDEYEDTRIDFIFDIVSEELYQESGVAVVDQSYPDFKSLNKERGSFIIIAHYLKKHSDYSSKDIPIGLQVWKRAWDIYMTFKEWFENREWYHFIGYLISVSDSQDAKEMLELFSPEKHLSKTETRREIMGKIMEHAGLRVTCNGVKRDITKDEYRKYLGSLKYGKSDREITDTLLLFNVLSVISDSSGKAVSTRDTYFPFARYKKEKWNLEHIHSIADGNSFTLEFANEYTGYLREMLERIEKEDKEKLEAINAEKGRGRKTRKLENPERDALKKALSEYERVKAEKENTVPEKDAVIEAAMVAAGSVAGEFESALEPEKLDGIGNMALLDEKTNKSYHNAPFFMKRMIISDIVKGNKGSSRFIPFCTRNVFDKAYTVHPSNMLHWSDNDCDEYRDEIVDAIYAYFKTAGNGGERDE